MEKKVKEKSRLRSGASAGLGIIIGSLLLNQSEWFLTLGPVAEMAVRMVVCVSIIVILYAGFKYISEHMQ